MATAVVYILLAVLAAWVIAHLRVPFRPTTLLAAAGLAAFTYFCSLATYLLIFPWTVFALIAAAVNVPRLRRALVSNAVFAVFRKRMPPVPDTERDALGGGSVRWEAEFFSGRPRSRRLLKLARPALAAASAKVACRGTGAYARTRRRFNLPIGHFGGVEEALARIAANTYVMNAARQLTLVGLDTTVDHFAPETF